MNAKICTSCKKSLTNDKGSIAIKCPKCNADLKRCTHCREIGTKYKCSACDFIGP